MSFVWVLLYNEQKGGWKRERERRLSWGTTVFRNHEKMRGDGEPGKQRQRAEKVEQTRKMGKNRERRRRWWRRSEGCREGVRDVWGKTSVTVRAPAYPSVTYFILHQHAERGMRRGWWIIEEKERWMRMRLLSFRSLLPPQQPLFSLFAATPFFILTPGQKKIL